MEHRRTVLYSGRVQGVGFRWTALQVLQGMSLTGYVRNLPDGRVELVLEGRPADTDAAVARVRTAMVRLIDEEQESTAPATGEFPDLSVRR